VNTEIIYRWFATKGQAPVQSRWDSSLGSARVLRAGFGVAPK
jgi:hypothetical protein